MITFAFVATTCVQREKVRTMGSLQNSIPGFISSDEMLCFQIVLCIAWLAFMITIVRRLGHIEAALNRLHELHFQHYYKMSSQQARKKQEDQRRYDAIPSWRAKVKLHDGRQIEIEVKAEDEVGAYAAARSCEDVESVVSVDRIKP
jgi:hypothetical protein